MAEHRQEKRPRRGLLVRKSVLAANLALFAFAAWGFGGEYMRNRALDREIAALEEQAQTLEADNLEIARLGKRLAAQGEIERDARLKLNLMKPGEEVVVVKEAPQPAAGIRSGEERQRAPEENVSNPRKWWRYLLRHR